VGRQLQRMLQTLPTAQIQQVWQAPQGAATAQWVPDQVQARQPLAQAPPTPRILQRRTVIMRQAVLTTMLRVALRDRGCGHLLRVCSGLLKRKKRRKSRKRRKTRAQKRNGQQPRAQKRKRRKRRKRRDRTTDAEPQGRLQCPDGAPHLCTRRRQLHKASRVSARKKRMSVAYRLRYHGDRCATTKQPPLRQTLCLRAAAGPPRQAPGCYSGDAPGPQQPRYQFC
jgi:hypothetical protein